MKKIYVMTDLEGVAGVENFEDWCEPASRYYDLAREFLTMEVNAAVAGLFEGGAKEILVSDGHGAGAIDPKMLSPRVDLLRGWPNGWPLELDRSFDGVVFVGQHAKAGTPCGHLCHTQSLNWIDLAVNGRSIGEFGQLAMCASELMVRTIFGAGDEEFTKEALKLVPGMETVAVKRGLRKDTGEDLDEKDYKRHFSGAIHMHPERSRKLIHAGAKRAMVRAKKDRKFGIIPLKPPFERVIVLRPNRDSAVKRVSRVSHPTSVIAMMNLPNDPRPMKGE